MTQTRKRKTAAPPPRPERETRLHPEDSAQTSPLLLVLWEIVLFFLAVLMGYMIIVPQDPGVPQTIRETFYGLAGNLALLFPLASLWCIVLIGRKRRGRPVRTAAVVSDALLFFCVPACVHIFHAERICREEMYLQTFTNFVYKSFSVRRGGGAIGAVLSWPMYRYLGTWGGFLVLLGLATILLTISGKLTWLANWLAVRLRGLFTMIAEARAESAYRREQKRREKQEREDAELARLERVHAQSAKARTKQAPEETFEVEDDGYYRAATPEQIRRPGKTRAAKVKTEAGEKRVRRDAERPEMRMPDLEDIIPDYSDPAQAPLGLEEENGARPARKRRNEKNERPSTMSVKLAGEKRTRRGADADDTRGDLAAELQREIEPMNPAGNEYDPFELEPDAVRPEEIEAADAQTAIMSGRAFPEDEEPVIEDIPEEAEIPVIEDVYEDDWGEPEVIGEPDDYEDVEPEEIEDIEPDDIDESEPEDIEPEDDMPLFADKKPLQKMRRPEMHAENQDEDQYYYPPIDLLEEGGRIRENYEAADRERAEALTETLRDFGIETQITGIAHGPAVTRFELKPKPGIRVNRIQVLADDIAMRLAATSVRIEAPIPGKPAVGVEVPNEKVETVHLRDVLVSKEAEKHPSKIAVGLGKDNSGRYVVADIAKMPHVLIAGQTGSGKSVCINSIITSILFRASPDEVRLILVDPKVVELSIYNGIPHLVCPVVTDPKKAASALNWAVSEMTNRYKLFAERGVRDIKGYNKALPDGEKIMPQMVIIIDELADLMMACPGEVEDAIQRLAQLARACGIHLVIATQRPSVNVITGVIKANIPTRIAFSVASQVDSRTMIDHAGAENLLGNGDMLYVPSGGLAKANRVQGTWVSDDEVHAVVEYIKARSEATYDQDMIEQMDKSVRSDAEQEEVESEYDPRLPEAVEIVVQAGQASVSMLQRKMRVGYARAGRLIDEMEKRGIVSANDGAKPREVLITREQLSELFEDGE